ncbi:hypothetical protein ACX27_19945 [Nostoc piscinale CENA21]|uniref:Uncharacterized protein n=1 Tax=Nostoc piscinale CENA21 TaxID=224013 RepID=A0A0M3V608_9NOSO|nr:hypothetical protein ACX27_19945 [Nostoc piscinale CENA21]
MQEQYFCDFAILLQPNYTTTYQIYPDYISNCYFDFFYSVSKLTIIIKICSKATKLILILILLIDNFVK